MKPKWFLAIVSILMLFLMPQPSPASDEKARRSDTLTFYLENDLFAFDKNDRYYTHGTRGSWISQDLSNYRDIVLAPAWMHRFIEWLPAVHVFKFEEQSPPRRCHGY